MRRDMNLIRLLLLEYEDEEPKPDLSAYTEAELVEHSALVIEAGLVHGQVLKSSDGNPRGTAVLRLTWAGHEFLAAARNETIWKKAVEQITRAGVSVTVSVLQELLKQYLRQELGIP
jgi:hypothetical protein